MRLTTRSFLQLMLGGSAMPLVMGRAAAQQGTARRKVTIGVGSEATSLDPHFYGVTANRELARHIFEPLVEYDGRQQIVSCLAASWKRTGPLTWEFGLQRDAVFSDGTPFTAKDVVFTFERIPTVTGSPSNYELYTRPFDKVEAVDDHTVRMTTKDPYPDVLNNLQNIPIISHRVGGGVKTEDFNSGRALVGTGPFRFVEWRRGDRIGLARNDRYWRQAPHWDEVEFRPFTKSAARTAALLTGAVDVINQVPGSDLAQLRSAADTRVVTAVGPRLIMFMINQAGEARTAAGDAGQPLDRNPLSDERVRRALSMAINRPAIVERVMDGLAVAADQVLPEIYVGKNGYVKPDKYDPAAARKLLAEAGYPNGFSMTLNGSNDRYLNDDKVVQVIAQMLTRIGLKVKVETLPGSAYFGKAANRSYDYFLVGVQGMTQFEIVRSLLVSADPDKGHGARNWGGFRDREVDGLFETATREIDDAKRNDLLQRAEARAFNDLHCLTPLFFEMNVWSTRRGVSYDGRFDGQTYAFDIRPS